MSDQSIAAPTEFRKPTNRRFIDLTDQTFGRLTVLSFHGTNARHNALWLCECSCGSKHVTTGRCLRSGGSQSCGCLQKELLSARFTKHGDTGKNIRIAYFNMLQRCYYKRSGAFEDYGGRGISVCEEWRSNYLTFRDWALSHGYRDGLTIERDDVNGPYEPGNCRFIPKGLQGRNRRNNKLVTAFGESKLIVEWTEDSRCKVGKETLKARLKSGCDAEKAISTPPKPRK